MDKYFLMSARGATLKNEIYAGFVTFLAMSYALLVLFVAYLALS